MQDIEYCKTFYPKLIYKAISVQFMDENIIAIFNIDVKDEKVFIVEEKHYRFIRLIIISH